MSAKDDWVPFAEVIKSAWLQALTAARNAALEEAAVLVESLCYAYEGDEVCQAVNANLRKAAKELRHRAAQDTGKKT